MSKHSHSVFDIARDQTDELRQSAGVMAADIVSVTVTVPAVSHDTGHHALVVSWFIIGRIKSYSILFYWLAVI